MTDSGSTCGQGRCTGVCPSHVGRVPPVSVGPREETRRRTVRVRRKHSLQSDTRTWFPPPPPATLCKHPPRLSIPDPGLSETGESGESTPTGYQGPGLGPEVLGDESTDGQRDPGTKEVVVLDKDNFLSKMRSPLNSPLVSPVAWSSQVQVREGESTETAGTRPPRDTGDPHTFTGGPTETRPPTSRPLSRIRIFQ